MQSHHDLQSVPTPPFSPRAPYPNKSTALLLDSLVSFYRQEMMWVYRTRAALELESSTSDSTDSTDDRSNTRLPAIAASDDDVIVEAEPPTSPPISPTTRWLRRKQNFKLRLDGIPPHRRRQVGGSKSGVHVLELFESMMEARMESCERVHRLVKAANRANLYVR
jgi:hypothetical protein